MEGEGVRVRGRVWRVRGVCDEIVSFPRTRLWV